MSKEKINTIGCTLIVIFFLLFCILFLASILSIGDPGMKMAEIKGTVVDEAGNPITNAMIVLTSDKSTIVGNGFVQGDCSVFMMGFRDGDNIDGKFKTGFLDYSSAKTYFIFVAADGCDTYKETIKLSGGKSVDLHTITLHQ